MYLFALALSVLGPAQASTVPGFVENAGQWDRSVRFMAEGPGVALWVSDRGATYEFRVSSPAAPASDGRLPSPPQVRSAAVRVSPVAAGASVAVGRGLQPGRFNYYGFGPVPVEGARAYGEVWSMGAAPGVDARFLFDAGRPRYDLVVRPGADPAQARLRYEGVRNLRIEGGTLAYDTPLGTVRERGLQAFQESPSGKRPVPAVPRVYGDGTVGFAIGAYDRSRPLVIDPVLWFDNRQGVSTDAWSGVAADQDPTSEGTVVSGVTAGAVFPGDPGDANMGTYRPIVARFARDGSLLWKSLFNSTWAGGSHHRVSVWDGHAYIASVTTLWPGSTGPGGLTVAKLSVADGTQVAAHSLGAISPSTLVSEVAASAGGVAVAATTGAASLATTPDAWYPAKGPGNQGVLAILSPVDLAPVFSTYHNASTSSSLNGAAWAEDGDLVISGTVGPINSSTPVPVGVDRTSLPFYGGVYQTISSGLFVARLAGTTPEWGRLLHLSYIGPTSMAQWGNLGSRGVAVTPSGNLAIAGTINAWASNVATITGWNIDASMGNTGYSADGLFGVLSGDGASLHWLRTFGGSGTDSVAGVAALPGGRVAAFGSLWADGATLPAVPGETYGPTADVSQFGVVATCAEADGSDPGWQLFTGPATSSLMGAGAAYDAVASGDAVVVAGAVVGNFGGSGSTGSWDAFLARMTDRPTVVATVEADEPTYRPLDGDPASLTITLSRPAIGDLTVALSTDNPAVSVPATVSFAEGEQTQTVPATLSEVGVDVAVTVEASVYGSTAAGTVQLSTRPKPVAFLAADSIVASKNRTSSLTVELDAPSDGRVDVDLSVVSEVAIYHDITIASPTYSVPVGESTATFEFTINGGVAVARDNFFTAASRGKTLDHTLSLMPPSLASIELPDVSNAGGINAFGTVTLSEPAPADGQTIRFLVLDSADALVPSAEAFAFPVEMPAGESTASFRFKSTPVVAPKTYRVVCAGIEDTITIRPPGVLSITVDRPSPIGGEIVTATVRLEAVATFATPVTLDVAGPATLAASSPSPRTIPLGSAATIFKLVTTPVHADTDLVLTATANGVAVSRTLNVSSPAPLLFEWNHPSRVPGQANYGRVKLATKAPAGGFQVQIAVTGGSAVLDRTYVTVAAGGYLSNSFKVVPTRPYPVLPGVVEITATVGPRSCTGTFDVVAP